MLSWQITTAAAGEHGDQLRRDAAAARSARSARASAPAEAPKSGRLALDPEEVYPDEPAEGRGAGRRTASGRRR